MKYLFLSNFIALETLVPVHSICDILNQNIVGVSMEGTQLGRYGKLFVTLGVSSKVCHLVFPTADVLIMSTPILFLWVLVNGIDRRSSIESLGHRP